MAIIQAVVLFVRAFIMGRAAAAVENLALRQQVAVFKQSVKRPKLRSRDRDGIYGDYLTKPVQGMGIEEVLIAPRSPWQNPHCERVIGSIRRECLDHVVVLNERHLYRILTDYFDYYHNSRPHLSPDRNSPAPRKVEPPSQGEVISIRQVGGLHHRYSRAA